MPRQKYKPTTLKHIDPAKKAQRSVKVIGRARKPRVVLGTAAARALGIGVPCTAT